MALPESWASCDHPSLCAGRSHIPDLPIRLPNREFGVVGTFRACATRRDSFKKLIAGSFSPTALMATSNLATTPGKPERRSGSTAMWGNTCKEQQQEVLIGTSPSMRVTAGVLDDSLRAQTGTFYGPGLQKKHQNSTRRHPERHKKNEMVAGEGKKKSAKFWAPHPSGPPPIGAPTVLGPIFSRFGPHPLGP